MAADKKLVESVNRLKKQRNAVILAHVYQRGEVQDIADYVGDSLDLSRKAVQTDADVIVFCGVQFMAETAAILNPGKTVLLPDKNAGCGLADMATSHQVAEIIKQDPELKVVSYVNSSAGVKAVSDGKLIQLWNGYCYVHEQITVNNLMAIHDEHPHAEIIVHPECTAPVRHLADFTGSTSQMSRYVKESEQKEFIVGTETNFVYRLEADNPDKMFYPVHTFCEGMNSISLEKIKWSLEKMENEVRVPEKIRIKAKIALDKMLEVL